MTDSNKTCTISFGLWIGPKYTIYEGYGYRDCHAMNKIQNKIVLRIIILMLHSYSHYFSVKRTHTCTYTNMHTQYIIYTCIHTCIYIHIHSCIYTHTYTHVLYICMFMDIIVFFIDAVGMWSADTSTGYSISSSSSNNEYWYNYITQSFSICCCLTLIHNIPIIRYCIVIRRV